MKKVHNKKIKRKKRETIIIRMEIICEIYANKRELLLRINILI